MSGLAANEAPRRADAVDRKLFEDSQNTTRARRTRHTGVLRDVFLISHSSNPLVRRVLPHLWVVQYLGGFHTVPYRLIVLIA